jgi:hypothetical protein
VIILDAGDALAKGQLERQRLDRLFRPLHALIANRLKPYEDHADRLLAKKALPPEVKITNPAVRPLFEAVGRVLVALERSPSPEG